MPKTYEVQPIEPIINLAIAFDVQYPSVRVQAESKEEAQKIVEQMQKDGELEYTLEENTQERVEEPDPAVLWEGIDQVYLVKNPDTDNETTELAD